MRVFRWLVAHQSLALASAYGLMIPIFAGAYYINSEGFHDQAARFEPTHGAEAWRLEELITTGIVSSYRLRRGSDSVELAGHVVSLADRLATFDLQESAAGVTFSLVVQGAG